ncbi:hypothetical protein ElyMa_004320800 [Elysia marginata]|uniref:Uncharacterized protein n=1 Tax=Elysia marginata TaxID=1093978 RepID=A0AAV4H0D2_9GAST|nr:hypothetical protein ElyMa_004320800 [Elysia marginata]
MTSQPINVNNRKNLDRNGLLAYSKHGSLQTAASTRGTETSDKSSSPVALNKNKNNIRNSSRPFCSSEDPSLPVPSSRYTSNTNRPLYSCLSPRQTRPQNRPRKQFYYNDNP